MQENAGKCRFFIQFQDTASETELFNFEVFR